MSDDDHGHTYLGIAWRDVCWNEAHGLAARIYEPAGDGGNGAVVLDVHGGAWASQDRTLGERYDEALAEAGFCVVAVDFRDGRTARHPAGSADVADAVGWVRQQAASLGVDGDHVALVGSSSGGHLALYAALTMVEVSFVAALWPPLDPLGRYRYAASVLGRPVPQGQTFEPERLMRSTEAYFGDEAAMAEAAIAAVLRRREQSSPRAPLPALWLARAGEDLNVPAELLDEVVESYRAAGGGVELTDYPGEVHGFGHARHDGARRFQADLVARVGAALA